MVDESKERRGRRVRTRRNGLAFSSGGLSDSTTGGGVAAADEVDDSVEGPVEDLNAAVREAVPPTVRMTEEEQSALVRANANMEEFTPSSRLAQVRSRSSEYEREYRLNLLHRLLMRNLPLDEIAANLGVSVSTVVRDRTELRNRLRQAAKELDIEHLIGDSKGFYEEVKAMAMRAASSSSTPLPMRLAAMRTALASHNDMNRFFQAAGVFDVLRFRKGAGDGQVSDIQRLMAVTEDLMADMMRETRMGDNPLGDYSGTDAEVMDL